MILVNGFFDCTAFIYSSYTIFIWIYFYVYEGTNTLIIAFCSQEEGK